MNGRPCCKIGVIIFDATPAYPRAVSVRCRSRSRALTNDSGGGWFLSEVPNSRGGALALASLRVPRREAERHRISEVTSPLMSVHGFCPKTCRCFSGDSPVPLGPAKPHAA
jgi:hypothetical protein